MAPLSGDLDSMLDRYIIKYSLLSIDLYESLSILHR